MGSINNYYSKKRLMAIRTDVISEAFVLSHINDGTVTKSVLFKFNPNFFDEPVWVLDNANRDHLGLVFGRNQTHFYVSSMNSSESTV